VDVPLPLGLEPVVPALGLAELAAGSPVVAPLPLGAPFCAARAIEHVPRRIPAIIAISFMIFVSRFRARSILAVRFGSSRVEAADRLASL
jgi:hypothetical protein